MVVSTALRAQQAPPSVPYNWRNVEVVGGGFVTGIIFSPKQPDLVYARTDIGGAYRWNPTTKRWVPLTDWVGSNDANDLGIESLATDPTDANRVYLAVGTYTQSWAGPGAILRSTDRGSTWQRTEMPFKMGGNEDGRSMGERLAVDPNQNSTLYFGSRHNGLWMSSDYGVNWKRVETFPTLPGTGTGIGFVLFDARSGAPGRATATIFADVAVPGAGLYRSDNSGATWRAVPGQPPGLLPHHGVLDGDGNLYLTYSNGPGPNGVTNGAVYKYDTGIGTWTDITPEKPGNFGYAGLAVDAMHPRTVMVSTLDRWGPGDDIFRSTDGGAHWTSIGAHSVRDSSIAPFLNWGRPTAALGHWIGDLEIDPFNPGHVLYVTGATIWGSDNVTAADNNGTTNWTVRAQGLEETAVLDLISPPAGAHLLSGLGDIGGFRHDDLTVSPPAGMYTNPTFNNTTSLDFAQANPSFIVRVGSAGNNTPHGAYSNDGGTTWTPFATEPPASRGSGTVAVAADGGAIVWTPQGAPPHFTRDHGATWTACTGVAADTRVVADRVAVSTFYAYNSADGSVLASTDDGATFEVRAIELPKGKAHLSVAPGHAGDLWLALNDGLYHSTDGGANFARVDNIGTAWTLGFGQAAPGATFPAVYLTGKNGGVSGVFRSDDGGGNWVRINDQQHQYGWIGQVVTGDPRIYGRVYLGTNGRGILVADPVG